ncbi:MAG: hypothetical protein Q8869_01130 [Candidatus Phytoplasma australasiaticum]|nr:hypothetical protein [Candidatus Phytoplasma australasiaticum]
MGKNGPPGGGGPSREREPARKSQCLWQRNPLRKDEPRKDGCSVVPP